jgi:hypothetical protein
VRTSFDTGWDLIFEVVAAVIINMPNVVTAFLGMGIMSATVKAKPAALAWRWPGMPVRAAPPH